ncbi:hypothetical protein IEN85_01265 [Pelagicoccus sp. NFK12]|uniref:Uncharacterized protein n=1 Tax=Pelagicoccus enzymogenes TaxID=2773457 RepID=A0A927IFX8_9BACT|nr:hypothetical protein [Pelagicoccus enzymogenes]MBD5778123.1 hypothetical protein [Pelagicoccus enzymogenes]
MQNLANPSSLRQPSLPEDPPHRREPTLNSLCQQVLAYALKAKVQRFRYCRQPSAPSSPHRNLAEALRALSSELEKAARQPVCQTQAIELLRELASLAHQPPCQSSRQQKAAALLVNAALLDLR